MTPPPLPGSPEPPPADDPLGLLAAEHSRLRQLAATLRDLGAARPTRGDHAWACDTASLVRAVDAAVRRHREDQEEDLFPALLESMAGSDPVCLRGITGALRDEHRALEGRWRALRPHLAQAAQGVRRPWPADDVESFGALLERHLHREEAELLPMAARLLADAELQHLGRTLRARRARE